MADLFARLASRCAVILATSSRRRASCLPAEGWLDVQLLQPVRPHRLSIGLDLGHILAQAGLVPGHPHLGAGPPLLVAGTPAERPAGTMPVPAETGDPDPVVHPLHQYDYPHAAASDDRGGIVREAGRTRRPVEVGGSGMAGRIRLGVANAATRARAAGVSACGGREADGPLTRARVQFLR